jgi:hypothetical protein
MIVVLARPSMFAHRFISILTLIASFLAGGLAGDARAGLCWKNNGEVVLMDRDVPCSDVPDSAGAPCGIKLNERTAHFHLAESPCKACADLPVGTGEGHSASTRDLHPQATTPMCMGMPIPQFLLPICAVACAVWVAPSVYAPLPTHVSVGTTALRF